MRKSHKCFMFVVVVDISQLYIVICVFLTRVSFLFSGKWLFQGKIHVSDSVNNKRPRGLDTLLELKTQYTKMF